ncbi:MAG: hypothetical protein D6798_02860 [Deltaproteobacteria bacterium]|nr:MAG: hypothetical protein D6798_02860 [Deltaproteobacteria bacterium]
MWYLGVATAVTWPALVELGTAVPGAARTDLHNALWSQWFVWRALTEGSLPFHTTLLDPPGGGVLVPIDPLGSLMALPLVGPLGLATAYSLVVLVNVAASGWVAHRFARAVARSRGLDGEAAGFVAGIAYASAPILRAAVVNGTSEGIGGQWAALAAWACWRAAQRPGAGRILAAALALLLAALGSWYGAVTAFLFAGALVLVGPGTGEASIGGRRRALIAAVLGVLFVLPLAVATTRAATRPDNLVRIKSARELANVRRSTGAADPRGFVVGGDFRSPDFRRISRYGEQFFHCNYLGWGLILAAAFAGRRGRSPRFLWAGGGAGLLLAMGPVLVMDGAPVVIAGDRVIGLPYFLVERLPGFSSLSLVYRLTQAPALALALLAGLGAAATRRPGWAAVGMVALICIEGRWVCPLKSLPDTTSAEVAPSIRALADQPPGIVLEYPVVGGRAYLYEQTVHQHPIAGTLNFPNNAVGMQAWAALIAAAAELPPSPADTDCAGFREFVRGRAERLGVRYVVAHADPYARPDIQDSAVQALSTCLPPLVDGDRAVQVYRLW